MYQILYQKMATFKIMIDPRTPIKQDGTRAIVLRITEKGKRNYLSLGLSVKPDRWNETESKFKRAHDPQNYKELNHNLGLYLSECEKITSGLIVKKISFTFDHFKSQFLVPKDIPGVFEFFDITIETLRSRKQIGNSKVYYHTKNALWRYSKRKELNFQEITPPFLEGFESHLIKENCSGNTIHHYMRTFRALYYRAVENGYVNHEINPFFNNYIRKGYRFSHLQKATPKRALSKEELQRLIQYKPSPMSKEEDAKLIFLFSYYTWGMNIVDIAKLRWDKNIQPHHIIYSRTKTRYTKTFRIPIIEPVREILSVCREYSPKGHVFSILDESANNPSQQYTRIKTATREINRVLKEVGNALMIPVPLTTYVARHTFASVLKKLGTSSSVIKEMMGHTKEETTEIYLKEFENETLAKAGELLKLDY